MDDSQHQQLMEEVKNSQVQVLVFSLFINSFMIFTPRYCLVEKWLHKVLPWPRYTLTQAYHSKFWLLTAKRSYRNRFQKRKAINKKEIMKITQENVRKIIVSCIFKNFSQLPICTIIYFPYTLLFLIFLIPMNYLICRKSN